MSNFLGDIPAPRPLTSLLSASELMGREGLNMQKGMNFRKDAGMHSVFLVLPSHSGEYREEWNPALELYTYEGHDSTTVEAGGKSKDQLLMYGGGKLTDNGKFFKAATEFKDGLRKAPLSVRVYEKIDPGVWYDKGLFHLVDARRVHEAGRVLFKFDLRPSDFGFADRDLVTHAERILPVTQKVDTWLRNKGRCCTCGAEAGLRFVPQSDGSGVRLLCAEHRGESRGLLGL